jgi:hypothetical protein
MKKHFAGFFCILLLLSLTIISWKPASAIKSNPYIGKPIAARAFFEKYIDNIYESAQLQESGLSFVLFKRALTGFLNLKASEKLPQKSSILTVIDYAKSSCEKRMWIIDVINKELILKTWVAHGKGSGKDMAKRFSDKNDSFASSLGFYLTDDVYYGDNGRSLRLDGLDAGFNTNARKRAIVIHPAAYVCQAIIEQQGRLGLSLGCPAVSPEVADQVIDAIKDKTVLFVNGNSRRYSSIYLNEETAANYIAADANAGDTASL